MVAADETAAAAAVAAAVVADSLLHHLVDLSLLGNLQREVTDVFHIYTGIMAIYSSQSRDATPKAKSFCITNISDIFSKPTPLYSPSSPPSSEPNSMIIMELALLSLIHLMVEMVVNTMVLVLWRYQEHL